MSGSRRDYLSDHPGPDQIRLLVEVSDTTLRDDHTRQLSLYAKHGIRETWILNLMERVLEVYRDPQPHPAAELGASYSSRFVVAEDGNVEPLAVPGRAVQVKDLLP